ncbi:hypothetical protein TeGR_g214 [Tetraparma gracilis]|uniref:Uncharacterized protein n=1 Tax=Tetraparma gracilis TaxID=2962635 RepID=A0ABQ6MNW0_9STRA|nr:hypothetical protein TeGR_g214 [Tetraparma gracilis]
MINNNGANNGANQRSSSRASSRAESVDALREAVRDGERQISISSNRPATTILATDHMLDPNHDNKSSVWCGITVSGNSKTLLISTILFLSITTGQYFAAIIAHSISLKADCVSMLVDALSYIGNLFAECTPSPRAKKRLELAMSGVSFGLLLYFTSDFILESVANISHVMCLCGAEDDPNFDPIESANATVCHLDEPDAETPEVCEYEEDVNAYIVMFFALGGLLFDVLSLLAYKYFTNTEDQPKKKLAAGEEEDPNFHPHHHHLGDHPLEHRHGSDHAGHNVNMLSALMHVFSDLLRSTTTLIESIVLFQYPNIDSVRVDGWCALIVCSLIALGAIWSLLIWLKEVYRFCTKSEQEIEEEEQEAQHDHLASYRALGDTV